jgi:hypothetical protein
MQNVIRVLLFGASGVLALPAAAANLVQNPDFATDLEGWTVTEGNGTISLDDTTGSPAAPSMQVKADGTDTDTSASSSCMPVDDSNNVDLYADIKGTAGFAIATIATFSDADCTTALSAIASEAFPATGEWATYSMSDVVLPDGAQSARVVLTASMGASTDHGDANFDHIQFGPTGTTIGTVNVNQEGLSGTWYNPQTSGQGMQFQFSPDDGNPAEGTMFGAWYTYDIVAGTTASSQRWYSVQTELTGDAQSAAVRIYRNLDGNFDAPPATTAEQVGTGVLTFDTCDTGEFSYVFGDGRASTIPLRRLLPNVSCVTSGEPTNPAGDFGYTGPWYNTATGGQGMLIEVNPTATEVFVGWYSYAESGEGEGESGQRWFSAQAPYTVGDRTFDLTIFTSTGGSFDTGGGVTTTPVGTATLTFTSCTEGTFDYTFTAGELSGKTGSIPLTRLGPVPQSCQPVNN